MLSHRRSLLRRVRLATPLRLPRNSRASLFARAARFPHSPPSRWPRLLKNLESVVRMPPCARSFSASASASTATSPVPMERSIFSSCPRTIRWARFSPRLTKRSWAGRPMRGDSRWRLALRVEDGYVRFLSLASPRKTWRRHLRQRIPEKFRRKTPQALRKKHLADERRRARPRLPQRRSGRRTIYRHRSRPDRRRHPAFPQRLPATRIYPARKQDLLERPDRPQVRPRPQKTKAQKVGVGVPSGTFAPLRGGKSGEEIEQQEGDGDVPTESR